MSQISSPEFYARRSDRTVRCLDGRLPPLFHAVITVADGWENVSSTVPFLETLGNLLARFCTQITIVGNDAVRLGASKTLVIMKAADPFGSFNIASTKPAHDLEIRLGGGTTESNTQIAVSYVDWTAFVSGRPSDVIPSPPRSSFHNPGAELAACLAGAAAFRFWAERTTVGVAPFTLDLFDLSDRPNEAPKAYSSPKARPLSALLVGAGSVGSASGYFLPRLGFCGNVHVVDHDKIELENLDRSPIFNITHVGKFKAEVVADYLRENGVSASSGAFTWNELVRQNAALIRKHEVWLALANEHGVRMAMQSNYPPTTIQASTGRNWGVQFGRHIPFIDDCQIDRFPDEPAAPLKCADGSVNVAGKQVDAALPFASFTAGLLVATALIRQSAGELGVGPNMGLLSFFPHFNMLRMNRRARETCVCQKMSRKIWDRCWSH